MTPPLSCQELVELATAFLENALSDTDRARVEAHLAACDGCEQYLAQMEETIAALGKLSETVSPDTQQELLRMFREWRAA